MIKTGFIALAIAGIAAVAVPKYASAEKEGKELTVKSFLRTVTVINKAYRSRHRRYAASLEGLVRDSEVESLLETIARTGYECEYVADQDSWSCRADPDLPELTHYFVDETGVIRSRKDGPARKADPEI